MTRMAGRWPGLVLTLSLLVGPAAAASFFGADSPLRTAEARMQALITELSSPRYGGRLAGSAGDVLTRRLIQAEFRALGLQPAGELRRARRAQPGLRPGDGCGPLSPQQRHGSPCRDPPGPAIPAQRRGLSAHGGPRRPGPARGRRAPPVQRLSHGP